LSTSELLAQMSSLYHENYKHGAYTLGHKESHLIVTKIFSQRSSFTNDSLPKSLQSSKKYTLRLKSQVAEKSMDIVHISKHIYAIERIKCSLQGEKCEVSFTRRNKWP
jgi:hypothetical protein